MKKPGVCPKCGEKLSAFRVHYLGLSNCYAVCRKCGERADLACSSVWRLRGIQGLLFVGLLSIWDASASAVGLPLWFRIVIALIIVIAIWLFSWRWLFVRIVKVR